jgi:hypothetical protein
MQTKFKDFINENKSRTYNEFEMDLFDYLVSKGADHIQAEECIYYYRSKGWIEDCWRQGCSMKETVDQMRDEDGNIKWFK